jgi:hypothetical protein
MDCTVGGGFQFFLGRALFHTAAAVAFLVLLFLGVIAFSYWAERKKK